MIHTFHPYRLVGDRRIVATEAEWQAIEELHCQAQTAKCGRCGSEYDIDEVPEEEWPFECDMREEDVSPCGRVNEKPMPIGVIVDAEMFDGWEGDLEDADGHPMRWDTDEWMPHCVAGGPYLEMDDVRNRLFKFIDSCPHLRFMLPTSYRDKCCVCGKRGFKNSAIGSWSGDQIWHSECDNDHPARVAKVEVKK